MRKNWKGKKKLIDQRARRDGQVTKGEVLMNSSSRKTVRINLGAHNSNQIDGRADRKLRQTADDLKSARQYPKSVASGVSEWPKMCCVWLASSKGY